MAVSNRDRIGQMLDVMAPALEAFIGRVLGPELPEGSQWTALVAAKDARNGISREYSALDPQVQLRMLTENIPHQVRPGWYPFDGQLSRVQQSYASELRDVRNSWAHGDSFSDDDTYRALDTAERLLNGIGAGDAATAVAGIRLNLRRLTADKDDKRTLKAAAESAESAGLKPWREVLRPHDDVATGRFQASEFAADLYKVAQGGAQSDYADPVEFYSRTYLTEGLRDLISRTVRRLSGDDTASPIINLQTNFGGGKTHSMLALWHLAGGTPLGSFPQETQELLEPLGYSSIARPRRVAIVGNHFAPTGEDKPDGTRVHTIWGELAWQLGGAEGYALVADADRAGTNPGQALHELLARYSPAVILIDEWVAYARQLPDDTGDAGAAGITGGTFDTQFTFAQSLTEAVKATSGVLVAISIPASETGADPNEIAVGNAEEVGGKRGLEALQRLQNVVRRVADQWRQASSEESYHIVRQRLFVPPDAAALAAIRGTARAFVEFYRKHADDFPREARDAAYEERIRSTYPIHPELFDRLYEDWSSLERFQRTRGVLRLMNTVIHALWEGEDAGPLIMPGSIPLATAAVNAELTQYLQDSWKAVIDADVDGPNSEPSKIDASRPVFQQRKVTKRLARTVFFGAAPTIGSAQKGLERQRVFLGTAIPGDIPGNFVTALDTLGDRATYFYSGSGKYWYDLQANITRRAKDHAERLHPEDVWEDIRRRLRDQAGRPGEFTAVHVCPEDSGDVPDTDEARLVIVHPRVTHSRKNGSSGAMEFARSATESRGTAHRTYRNMLVFLAADEDRMAELDTAVRDYLAWLEVLAQADDLDLTQNQKNQATERRRQADETAQARLLGAYQWALVPEAPEPGAPFTIATTKVEGQAQSLAERVSRKLGADGALATQQAAVGIRLWLNRLPKLWEQGHVSVGELWRQYATYPYMARLRDRTVLTRGVVDQPLLWEQEGFAIALGWDGERYEGLTLPTDGPITNQITDSTLLVKPGIAIDQRRREKPAEVDENGDTTTTPTPGSAPGPGGDDTTTPPAKPKIDYFFGTKTLEQTQYALDFKKVVDEVLQHLASVPGVDLTVRVEISARAPEGFDETRVRIVSENSSALRFEQSGFEENGLQ